MVFPFADTEEQFAALEDADLRPGVDALRRRLGLAHEANRFEDGSLPVYAVGDDLVLKLFPPVHAEETPREAAALHAVDGRLPVPTPKVHDTGGFEGWGHVLMGRLKGEPVTDATDAQCAQLGEALRALHEIEPPELLPAPDWDDFVQTQKQQAVQRQQDGRLTGLFDFEPAMRGAVEYEFVATGIFTTKGDPKKQKALTDAYGAVPDPDRVMAYTLLHVYSNLPWYLREMPHDEDTLEALARRWFGI